MTDWYGYPYIALTGGADGALDSLDGSLLKDGDFAVVVVPAAQTTYIYTLDEDSGLSESSPTVISPDANAGDKRWVLTNSYTDASLVSFLSAFGTTRTTSAKLGDVVSILDFGAVGDGVTNDATAFNDASDYLQTHGGTLLLPPLSYYLNSQWVIDHSVYYNFHIIGHGAELLAGSSVTGSAVLISGGGSPHTVVVDGLGFNHRGNSDVNYAIEAEQTTHLVLNNISVESHDTKAGYGCIYLHSATSSDDDNCFWTHIKNFRHRPRDGADGTDATYGIILEGACNATKITGSSFVATTTGILLKFDPNTDTVANGVLLLGNDFEGCDYAGIDVYTKATTGYNPPGLRVIGNRVETCDSFFSIRSDGGGGATASIDHSSPPYFAGNYVVAGSVTYYIRNISGAALTVLDSQNYGDGEDFTITHFKPVKMVLSNNDSNLIVTNAAGTTGYAGSHIQMGNYHLWVDTSAKLRIKSGAPTSDTDGTIVGTQS